MSRKFTVLCNDKEWRFDTKAKQMGFCKLLQEKGWSKNQIKKVTVK